MCVNKTTFLIPSPRRRSLAHALAARASSFNLVPGLGFEDCSVLTLVVIPQIPTLSTTLLPTLISLMRNGWTLSLSSRAFKGERGPGRTIKTKRYVDKLLSSFLQQAQKNIGSIVVLTIGRNNRSSKSGRKLSKFSITIVKFMISRSECVESDCVHVCSICFGTIDSVKQRTS